MKADLDNPYVRSFLVGAVFLGFVTLRLLSRHQGDWTSFASSTFLVVAFVSVVAALLIGLAASRFEKMRSWPAVIVGTVAGSSFVLALLFVVLKLAENR